MKIMYVKNCTSLFNSTSCQKLYSWHCCNRLNYLVQGVAKDGRKKETWKHFSGQPSRLPRRGNSDTITEHSRTHTTSRIQPHSPTCSNLVPCRNSHPVQSEKIEIYILRHWGKQIRDPLTLEIVQCLFKRRGKVGGSRDSGNVGEGCHNNNTKNTENQFLSPLFLVGKKNGGPFLLSISKSWINRLLMLNWKWKDFFCRKNCWRLDT